MTYNDLCSAGQRSEKAIFVCIFKYSLGSDPVEKKQSFCFYAQPLFITI